MHQNIKRPTVEWRHINRPTTEPVVPAPRARQGVTGHNVRYVLGFSIAAIVIAFIIVYLIYFG